MTPLEKAALKVADDADTLVDIVISNRSLWYTVEGRKMIRRLDALKREAAKSKAKGGA
jgi:hypothetical protein